MLDLTFLEKAIAALQDGLRLYDENPLREDAREKVVVRDGVIQRFEFTFELSWKTLKRFLEEYGQEDVDSLSKRDLFRVGFEAGLIEDPVKWFEYLKKRNQTTHIYADAIAHDVFCAARDFLPDAKMLLDKMKARLQ